MLELLIPISLILVGLILIVIEVMFIPGTNVVGVIGVLGAGVGVVYAFATYGTTGGLLTLLATIAAAGALFYLMKESGAWDRFILADTLLSGSGENEEEVDRRSRLLGREGTAVTPLRPSGFAEIDGERIEVETEGDYIASGSRIRVVAMDRRRYLVRLAGGEDETRNAGEGADRRG